MPKSKKEFTITLSLAKAQKELKQEYQTEWCFWA